MIRTSLVVLACLTAVPAIAGTTTKASRPGAADKPLVDKKTLAVNETGLKKIQADAEAKAKLWDAKLKKTMEGVCKGC